CCPSQISRFLPSVGNYIYGVSADALWVNLYIGNTAEFEVNRKQVKLRQETNYPWDGAMTLILESVFAGDIRLRLPDWCKSYTIAVNGETVASPVVEKGYAVLKRKWKADDRITLTLDMPVEVVAADPHVKENIGKRAVQRGPLVYCAEQADNQHFTLIALNSDTKFNASFNSELLNGVETITALFPDGKQFMLIPYYAWDNREAGEMKVWIDHK
ncbi:MAG: glycoside hydrolase family 127 protein, partial [Dysgonamonadaceae bacterium]|nr:glycoside hydrolase family 127 protein [Dysgonamonadaceae bacterium]